MPRDVLDDDDRTETRCVAPVASANAHARPLCAFRTRLPRGARPPRKCSPKAMTRPSSTGSDAIASGRPARPVEESAGTLGHDPQTNEMQGGRISFCGLCGGSLSPQITRGGHPKRYCSYACRARAWREHTTRRRHPASIESFQDAFPEPAGDHRAGDKNEDSLTTGEEIPQP
jgi:hypothetical protein